MRVDRANDQRGVGLARFTIAESDGNEVRAVRESACVVNAGKCRLAAALWRVSVRANVPR